MAEPLYFIHYTTLDPVRRVPVEFVFGPYTEDEALTKLPEVRKFLGVRNPYIRLTTEGTS